MGLTGTCGGGLVRAAAQTAMPRRAPALQQFLEGSTTRRLRFSSQCGAGYSAVAPRGGDYLLHHRWVAFLFRRLTARAGGQESGQWTATPGLPTRPSTENLRFLVFRAGKGPTPRQSAGPATGGLPATSRRNPREGGKQGTPESGREAEELIAVEVERTDGMMPAPATELVALGWCARPSDTDPARSMEGTACHDPGPPRSPLSIVRVASSGRGGRRPPEVDGRCGDSAAFPAYFGSRYRLFRIRDSVGLSATLPRPSGQVAQTRRASSGG